MPFCINNDQFFILFFPWIRYLHENFRPPIVHRNFRSVNVLLNEKSEVRVSDCGLGHLLSSGTVGQVSLQF
jgi:serine/threonine protein kinase